MKTGRPKLCVIRESPSSAAHDRKQKFCYLDKTFFKGGALIAPAHDARVLIQK